MRDYIDYQKYFFSTLIELCQISLSKFQLRSVLYGTTSIFCDFVRKWLLIINQSRNALLREMRLGRTRTTRTPENSWSIEQILRKTWAKVAPESLKNQAGVNKFLRLSCCCAPGVLSAGPNSYQRTLLEFEDYFEGDEINLE